MHNENIGESIDKKYKKVNATCNSCNGTFDSELLNGSCDNTDYSDSKDDLNKLLENCCQNSTSSCMDDINKQANQYCEQRTEYFLSLGAMVAFALIASLILCCYKTSNVAKAKYDTIPDSPDKTLTSSQHDVLNNIMKKW
ncbi:MAG: hypothetical protein WC748_08085 [Legionellales bacterium]|jgi:hypothetical protein